MLFIYLNIFGWFCLLRFHQLTLDLSKSKENLNVNKKIVTNKKPAITILKIKAACSFRT